METMEVSVDVLNPTILLAFMHGDVSEQAILIVCSPQYFVEVSLVYVHREMIVVSHH